MRHIILSLIFLLQIQLVLAQEEASVEDLFKVDYDSPLTLDLEAQEEEKEVVEKKKKKKKKRNVYFGLKTRKGFTRTGFGNDVVFETFNMLKEYVEPPEYTSDFYWFDYKKRKIINSRKVNKRNAGVLHGPYRKMLGEQVLEEGWYYKGLKHRRWVRYNRHDILQNKTYWWKGWPQESKMAYYDFRKTQLKEVIPVHYGEKNGEYWAFHRDGSLAVRGFYKFGNKVELWREYYDDGRVKREVRYPEDPFNFSFTPYIVREWDKRGTLIYDHQRFMRSQR